MKFVFFTVLLTMLQTMAWAQPGMPNIPSIPSEHPTFTYNVGASTGNENGNTYTELNLALNWYVNDWMNWRNALFGRFGSNIKAVNGLDSAMLATYRAYTDDRRLGVRAFAGPGVRVASDNNSAVTAEAGLVFAVGGIDVGWGARYLSYFGDRQDTNQGTLPKNETQYFIVLAGGGTF